MIAKINGIRLFFDVLSDGLRNARINYRVVTWFFKRACCRYDVIDRLHQIKTPTLIIGAERDWICPIDQSRLMHRKIKGSRLVVIQDGRHMCFVEDNNLFVRSVRRFLGENCA